MSFIFFNDIGLIPQYIILFILINIIFFTSILWHEVGHWLYFRFTLKKDIQIYYVNKQGFKAGTESDYENITDDQYVGINLAGIFIGSFPIILCSIINTSPFPYLLVLVPYLYGCKKDIKNIMNTPDGMDDSKI